MREEGMRDAKVYAMRKFVANFMRLRSGAEERWNRARLVLWVVPFYFRHKNSSHRRSAANYSPLDKEGGREGLLDGEREMSANNSGVYAHARYICTNAFRADNYGSKLIFNFLMIDEKLF